MRITGIRMAQTRGGKRFWIGWSGSTNGFEDLVSTLETSGNRSLFTYHEKRPDGVIKKDCRSYHEHCETDQFIKLRGTLGQVCPFLQLLHLEPDR